MAKGPGRDQRGPMERLVRIAATLRAAGSRGVAATRLIEVAGFEAGEDPGSQLQRELRYLRRQGWRIDNVADAGEDGRYVMQTVDNRLRVRLSAAQQTALRRAVLLADRADLADRLGLEPGEVPTIEAKLPTAEGDERLTAVMRAVRRRCLLHFTYKGRPRAAHPASVRTERGVWYLLAREDGGEVIKTFVVGRMSDLAVDEPGTAAPPEAAHHPGLHPMSWQLDEPIEVTLRTTAQHQPDVIRWLGRPAAETATGDDIGLTYRVTNRAALRARLYELGIRVELVGPDAVRAELLGELAAVEEAGR